MPKFFKNNLKIFLLFLFTFLMVIGLVIFFHKKIEKVIAAPDIEVLKPTNFTEADDWTDEANAYDSPSTPGEATTYAYHDPINDPSITYHTWASAGQTHASRNLYVIREATGSWANESWGIYYSTNGGADWTAIETGTEAAAKATTTAVSISTSLDLSNLRVKITGIKYHGGSAGQMNIYDIWLSCEYTLNVAPTVNDVNLTPSPITLTENTTTTVTCTATITDTGGGTTISAATGTIYRSGKGYSCTANDNNCYPNKTCSLSDADGNNKYATCTADIWFHADPTDTGSPWESQTWQCYVIARDTGGLTGSSTDSTPPELNTTAALDISSSISYGTMSGGATSSQSQTVTVTTTGNTAIDVKIKGTDLFYSSYNIPGGQQEYALDSITYENGTDLSTTTYITLILEALKPVQHSPVQATATDNVYWRIGIPSGQAKGTYYGSTTVAATAVARAVLHTGQTTSYRTGDDASNDGTAKSYTDNGDGTVTDNHTLLMWQKDDQTSTTWATSVDYCYNIALCNDNTWQGSATTPGDCSSNGGTKYSDWRLPTILEVVTLLDYSCASAGGSCYGAFKNNALTWNDAGDGDSFWLSTTPADNTVNAYRLTFTGIYSAGGVLSNVKTNPYYVRCVRANSGLHTGQTTSYRTGDDASNDGTTKSYTDNGDGVVRDKLTNLIWQKDDQANTSWNNAIDYCKNLALCNDNTWQGSTTTPGDCSSNGGTKYDDWRLPTVIEGVTMLDYSCASAGESCYGDFQNNALTWDNTGDTGSFWLSTTRPEDTVSAYQPSTGLGSVGSDNKVNPYYQRCVRK